MHLVGVTIKVTLQCTAQLKSNFSLIHNFFSSLRVISLMYEKMLLITNWKGCKKNNKPKVAYICVRNVSSNPLFSASKDSFARFEFLTGV